MSKIIAQYPKPKDQYRYRLEWQREIGSWGQVGSCRWAWVARAYAAFYAWRDHSAYRVVDTEADA